MQTLEPCCTNSTTGVANWICPNLLTMKFPGADYSAKSISTSFSRLLDTVPLSGDEVMTKLKAMAFGGCLIIGTTACLTAYVVHMASVTVDHMHFSSIK